MCWSIPLYPGQYTVLLTSHVIDFYQSESKISDFYQSESKISDMDQLIDNVTEFKLLVNNKSATDIHWFHLFENKNECNKVKKYSLLC